jgi:transposase
MTPGNMRERGVQRLIASCLNDACRHTALIDVWSYPAETEIPYFRSHVACAKCGARGNRAVWRPLNNYCNSQDAKVLQRNFEESLL